MSTIKYVTFNDIDPHDFIAILNQDSIRSHLISHPIFNAQNIKEWVEDKIKCSAIHGCRIRAVYSDNILVGWCGIQKEGSHYEIAIVISQTVWGVGLIIFEELICWAKEFGHQEVIIHLLESRPIYQFLKRKSSKTLKTKMYGRNFISYHIMV